MQATPFKQMFRRYVITIDSRLWVIVSLSFLLILINAFTESSKDSEVSIILSLSEIIIGISESILSAFVFYFITIHIPKQKEKLYTFNALYRIIDTVLMDWQVTLIPIFNYYAKADLSPDKFYSFLERLKQDSGFSSKTFSSIYLFSSPIVPDRNGITHETMISYLCSCVRLSERKLSKLDRLYLFWDINIVACIDNFMHNCFFETIVELKSMEDQGILRDNSFTDMLLHIDFNDFIKKRYDLLRLINQEVAAFIN